MTSARSTEGQTGGGPAFGAPVLIERNPRCTTAAGHTAAGMPEHGRTFTEKEKVFGLTFIPFILRHF